MRWWVVGRETETEERESVQAFMYLVLFIFDGSSSLLFGIKNRYIFNVYVSI